MTPLSQILELDLYSGDDLAAALDGSHIVKSPADRTAPAAFSRLRDLAEDLRAADWQQWRLRNRTVEGTERDTNLPLRIRFTGAMRAIDFVAAGILGGGDWELVSGASHDADILVSDHPLAAPRLRRTAPIRLPQWVRQTLNTGTEWSDTLDALPRGHRKELGRLLRRHGYRARLNADSDAIEAYYDELHVPYLTRQFGKASLRQDRNVFLALHCRCRRLDLLHDGEVVAANLLEQQGRALAIKRHALLPGRGELRGRADVLDYFSLLTARLLGAGTLDFGLSRPHLEDGVFRYKAKWGCRVIPVNGLKADICIVPLRRTESCFAFLRRNHFLQRGGKNLVVRIPPGQDAEARALADRIAGIQGLRGPEFTG